MKTIAKREKKGKRILSERIHPVLVETEDFDARVALIQALIPLGLAPIEGSARKLAELQERRLESLDLVGVFLDGKRFAEDGMVIAVGVRLSGEKILLGIVQTATENERAASPVSGKPGGAAACDVRIALDYRRLERPAGGDPILMGDTTRDGTLL